MLHQQKIKNLAQGFLACWKNPEWTQGKLNVQIDGYNCWYSSCIAKNPTPEEIEINQQFYINVLELIQRYEDQDAIEKNDQILPF